MHHFTYSSLSAFLSTLLSQSLWWSSSYKSDAVSEQSHGLSWMKIGIDWTPGMLHFFCIRVKKKTTFSKLLLSLHTWRNPPHFEDVRLRLLYCI